MKFALIGGDKRSAILASLLRSDGHKVTAFALERSPLGSDIIRVGCVQGAVYGADCVILPLPTVKNGTLYTPFSDEPLSLQTLVSSLWSRQRIICGGLSDSDAALLSAEGLEALDLMRMGDFVVKNAALTAEAAISLMMECSERALIGSRVLVLGYGRIGTVLSQRLSALGCSVTAADRSGEKRAMAGAVGIRSSSFDELAELAHGFDFVVNTVPARVMDGILPAYLNRRAVLVELSEGLDGTLAGELGLKFVSAPGLPGKYAPYTSAQYMREAIYRALSCEPERAEG